MADSKNFRAQFLEKVGIKGAEEKHILENILQEVYIDLTKLHNFCLRFRVPSSHRNWVWELMLGIKCPTSEVDEFIMQQLQEQYDDLRRTGKVLCECKTEYQQVDRHAFMNLILEGYFPSPELEPQHFESCSRFSDIFKVVSEYCEDDLLSFWLSVRFSNILSSFSKYILSLETKIGPTLEREDSDGLLYKHLCNTKAFEALPIRRWMATGFASVLSCNVIGNIWDKVICGSSWILLHTTVALFLTLKKQLLGTTDIEVISCCFNNITEESSAAIVNLSIDMWTKAGSCLHPEILGPNEPYTNTMSQTFEVCDDPLAEH